LTLNFYLPKVLLKSVKFVVKDILLSTPIAGLQMERVDLSFKEHLDKSIYRNRREFIMELYAWFIMNCKNN